MKKAIQIIIFAIVFSLTFISCNNVETTCPDEQISQFRLGFNKDINDDINYYTLYLTIPTDSGTINDTIYKSDIDPGYIYIPVDITSDSSSFFIDFSIVTDTSTTTYTDIIAYTYSRTPILDNLECGFTMEFQIDKVYYTTNLIDSAYITSKAINTEKVNHVEIIY